MATSGTFMYGMKAVLKGDINLESGSNVKATLVTQDVTKAQLEDESLELIGDISAWEAAGDKDQVTLTGAVNVDASGDGWTIKLGDGSESLSFGEVDADETCTGIVVYWNGGSAADKYNLFFCAFDDDVTADGGTMTVTLNADGFGKVTATGGS